MSTALSKSTCITCGKGVGQFKCEGCSQIFCTKHVAEHRQTLNQQLEEVITEHDTFQHTIIEDKNQCHTLMIYIDQWEQKSIDKIQQTAKEIREKVSELADTHKKTITQELHNLKDQIKKAREEDDFFETDLRNWSLTLEKLKQELKIALLSNNITENLTLPLVYQIQICSLTSTVKSSEINNKNKSTRQPMESNTMLSNEKSERHTGASSPVNKIHPRLQYTNQDGVYINPKSSLVTSIWYFYSPNHNRWFWTPYKDFSIWMSVDNLTVKSGYYKDQQPAKINIEIIEYLRQNNPIPSGSILHAALEAENRILKV